MRCLFRFATASVAVSMLLVTANPATAAPQHKPTAKSLAGTWRADVQFVDGPYAAVKDLKFLMTIIPGGTLIESSNYDGAPPVPPAYGIWRKTGNRKFELRYEFYSSAAPKRFEDISGGGGWMPAGVGVLKEIVTLAADGNSYASKISFELFDTKGKSIPGGGKAVCKATRMRF